MRRTAWVLVVGFVVIALGEGAARADAISPPPACPPGSHGRSSHAGEWCEPAQCQADSDCGTTGETCRPWRVCTRAAKASPGGRRSFDAPPIDVTLVVGSCAPDKGCKGNEEPPPPTIGSWPEGLPVCTNASFCVPASLPPLPTSSAGAGPGTSSPSKGGKGCGCRVGEPTEPLVGLGALLLAVGAGIGLRRRAIRRAEP